MAKLYNLARMTTATTGTGTVTLGVAVAGYLTFANAGMQNGDVLFYGINDGSSSEVGYGTYTSSATTLTRNVIKSTNSNAAISLDGSAQVYVTALAGDGGDLLPSFDHPMRGFDSAVNLQLNASVASNILNVAVKGNNGNDPSTSNPVLAPFRDATAANGDPAWVAITSALSINTNAVGATLGAANGTPFRFWVVLFNNGGTPVLGLVNCTGTGQIFALDEASVRSTSAMSSSATSAGVFYTPNGTTLTNCAFRILGYLEYSGSLTTAGTYSSAPTKLQLFGPGIKKPGEYTGNIAQASTASPTTISGTSWQSSALSVTMSLTAAMNAVEFMWSAAVILGGVGYNAFVTVFRGSTQVGFVAEGVEDTATNAGVRMSFSGNSWLDFPGATSATYTLKGSANHTFVLPAAETQGSITSNAAMTCKEIMG